MKPILTIRGYGVEKLDDISWAVTRTVVTKKGTTRRECKSYHGKLPDALESLALRLVDERELDTVDGYITALREVLAEIRSCA